LTSSASLRRLQVRHWALVGLAAVTSGILGGPGAGGVLLGGTAIGLSVLLYSAGLRAMVHRVRPRLAIGLLFVKLAALVGLGWLAFAAGRDRHPDPVGFALGLTCFPVAAVWESMRARGR
jgi:hypothetical protein